MGAVERLTDQPAFVLVVDAACARGVALLTPADYRAIEEALIDISEVAQAGRIRPDPVDASPLVVRLGSYRIFYRVDHLERTVRIVGIEAV